MIEEGLGMPLVSVITPTFNRRELLADAIASVTGQTLADLEMIIVDDGSTDGTREMVSELGDPRIRYHYQENRGQSAARNVGLRMARGRYVAFLDSDNTWLPERLERHVSQMEANPDVDIVYGITAPMGSDPVPAQMRDRPSGRITDALLDRNEIPFNSVLIRRETAECIGGFDESLRSAEDYDFWLRASVRSRFLFDAVVCTHYRRTPGSISSDLNRNFAANQRILRRFFEQYPEHAGVLRRARTWSLFYAGTSRQWTGVGRHGKAIGDAFRSVRHCPWSSRGYVEVLRSIVNAARRR